MMKLNYKIISTNIVVHYASIVIATVAGYWLIYWVTMWGLYGVANISKSESIMNWLADKNYFYPARESALSNYYKSHCVNSPIEADSNIGIKEGLEYLKRDVWIKDEMDSIPCLVGLFDELNEFDIDRIKTRKDLVEKSSELREIVLTFYDCDIRNLRKPYNRKVDAQIRLRFYLREILKAEKRQHNNDSSDIRTNNTNETNKTSDVRW